MLEGDILIEFKDQSFIKAFMNNNVITGVQRHFREDKSIANITDSSTGTVLWSVKDEGYSVLSCVDQRCTISSEDMTKMKNCLKIDDTFFIGRISHQYLKFID